MPRMDLGRVRETVNLTDTKGGVPLYWKLVLFHVRVSNFTLGNKRFTAVEWTWYRAQVTATVVYLAKMRLCCQALPETSSIASG
jgi:hypothetical protein